jgi:hypothetical protein
MRCRCFTPTAQMVKFPDAAGYLTKDGTGYLKIRLRSALPRLFRDNKEDDIHKLLVMVYFLKEISL